METFYVERYEKTRFFAVRDAADALVCVCVYRRGMCRETACGNVEIP